MEKFGKGLNGASSWIYPARFLIISGFFGAP
jgi:hypothetical protein